LAVPGSKIDSVWVVAVAAAFAVAWGVLMLFAVPWAHSPVRLSHFSTTLSLGIVATLARVTGGTDSPVLDYLWFVVVYAAFFYPPRQALAYWLACGLVHALPFLFVESDRHGALLRAVVEAPLRHRLRATVSIGLCDLEAASSPDEALRRADAACSGRRSTRATCAGCTTRRSHQPTA
jgi:hypothetical protein